MTVPRSTTRKPRRLAQDAIERRELDLIVVGEVEPTLTPEVMCRAGSLAR
jgi:hypothetical protein